MGCVRRLTRRSRHWMQGRVRRVCLGMTALFEASPRCRVIHNPPGMPTTEAEPTPAALLSTPEPARALGDESARLAALHALRVMDTLPEAVYDDIVALAAQICGTPIGLVSLLDSERQWFKARVGLGPTETRRDLAFCTHAIASPEPVFVVEDATHDPRFNANPLVTGAPHIRFYAGAPILLPGGEAMGTVCVIDTVPRTLDAAQLRALQALARQVTALFELRLRSRELEQLSAQAAAERERSAEMLDIVLRGSNLGLWYLHVPTGVVTVNERESEMVGLSSAQVQAGALAWREFVHPDDWAKLNAAIVPHLKRETPSYECEHRLRHKDGHWVWVLSRAVVTERDALGGAVRIVGTHMDITERTRDRQALQRTTDLLRRMGALAGVGGWELDLETGRVTWTDEVYRIHEVAPGTALELLSNIEFYAPAGRRHLLHAVESAIKTGMPYDLELPFITAKGRPLTVRTQGEAVLVDGKAVRLFGTFQDITERKRSEAALRLSEERLSLALSSTRMAVFDWDIATGRVYRGVNLSVMRGGPADEVGCTIDEVQAMVHPADVLAVRAAMCAVVRGETESYEFEHRIRSLDDRWVWINAIGRVTERGPDGRALRLCGIDEDVSVRKAAEAAARDSLRKLHTIANSLPALIAHIDTGQRYRFLNAQIGRVFGLDIAATLGRTMQEVRGEAAYALLAPHVEAALRGEKVSFVYADQVGGSLRHYQSNYIPDIDSNGQVIGFHAMTFDITELQETQARLELLARVDTLTGLPNRRQFDERMAQVMGRTRRTRQPMAVMYLDIDHFKSINDAFGHPVGDAVLCEFARRLEGCVRTTDTVARLAGDEFVILLEGIDGGAEAGLIAAKVVARIRVPFNMAGVPLAVTASVGVATYEGAAQTAAEMLALADRALYRAKKLGRDRYALV